MHGNVIEYWQRLVRGRAARGHGSSRTVKRNESCCSGWSVSLGRYALHIGKPNVTRWTITSTWLSGGADNWHDEANDWEQAGCHNWLEQQYGYPTNGHRAVRRRAGEEHQEAWAKHLGVPVEYTNSIGMKFVLIPPGEFMMGSTAGGD